MQVHTQHLLPEGRTCGEGARNPSLSAGSLSEAGRGETLVPMTPPSWQPLTVLRPLCGLDALLVPYHSSV